MHKKAYWVGLNKVPGLGPKRIQKLVESFGCPQEVWRAKEASLGEVLGVNSAVLQNLLHCRRSFNLEAEMSSLERLKVQVITWEDPSYPANLREIYDPPPVLYVRGNLEPKDARSLALVGSRKATPYGKAVAEKIAGDLVQNGFSIVSGLARGIDTASHRGALRGQGRTLAVLGCGVDIVYPRENQNLFEEIMDQGAVISEFPLNTPPEARNFPARNRLISGLSLGTLVVESAENGGALITVDFALEQGRDVFAIPGPITSRSSWGTNRLIKDGAKLVETAMDILAEYPSNPFPNHSFSGAYPAESLDFGGLAGSDPSVRSGNGPANPEERQVLEVLTLDPCSVETLTQESGLTPSRVNSILMYLEMKGLVQQVPGNRYVRKGGF